MTKEERRLLYKRTFMDDPEGARVLADLQARFMDVPIYCKGGPEGARETDFRAGRQAVIHFIFQQLGQVDEQPQELKAND